MDIPNKIKKFSGWFKEYLPHNDIKNTEGYYFTIPEIKYDTKGELGLQESQNVLILEEKLQKCNEYLVKKYKKFIHLDPFFKASCTDINKEDAMVEKVLILVSKDFPIKIEELVKEIEKFIGFKTGKITKITLKK